MLADYHLHSHVSHDARGLVIEHARAAEERGIDELCFTEHLDFYPSPDGLSCSTVPTEEELFAYISEVREADAVSRIRVRAGLEVDYKPQADRWTRELLGRLGMDFLMGSVHNVGRWPVSGPGEIANAFFDEMGPEAAIIEYLDVVEKAVATELFDSLAHLDLMKRFRPSNGELMRQGRVLDKIIAILDLMVSTDTGIEVNGAGLVHDPREVYPSLDLLRLARERGIKILTAGSDSHSPVTVGRNLETALSVAREAGFTRVYTFKRRVPTAHPL